jgi:hypothetical protein
MPGPRFRHVATIVEVSQKFKPFDGYIVEFSDGTRVGYLSLPLIIPLSAIELIADLDTKRRTE